MLVMPSVQAADMARVSNLDLNDKLVKRGLLVSWHGYRATVSRVRSGRCLVSFAGLYVALHGPASQWLPCSSVQVVKS